MATEMINIKLDSKFLKEIDRVVKANNYQSRTEFVRDALRRQITEDSSMLDLKAYFEKLRREYPIKKQTTDQELEKIRERVGREFQKRLK